MLSNSSLPQNNSEILFYYESRQNPNGDPGFENQPRLMPDDTILVTDVRIKRTIRDYARDNLNETIFVDYDSDGNAVTADVRAKQIISNIENENIDPLVELINNTFDVPLFGALVTIRSKSKGGGDSQKLTGPVQFGLSRSINKVHIINPSITTKFVGKIDENKEKQSSTIGKFYSVEYALIKVHGAIVPKNLGKYFNNEIVFNRFSEKRQKLFECLWNGTNNLVTRSKFPQRSILYIEIIYKSSIYNDLPILVEENDQMKKTSVSSMLEHPFIFENLIKVLDNRKNNIEKIKIASCNDISKDIESLVKSIQEKGIDIEEIKC
jgi:CRISPR-associated protein Csh2